jgi:hypothetical protein
VGLLILEEAVTGIEPAELPGLGFLDGLKQVGISSWGDPNCIATGFNYRVDITETLSFIEEEIVDPQQ